MSYCRKKALLLLLLCVAVFCTLFTFRAPPMTPTLRPLPLLLRQLLALPPLRALLPMPPLAATARKKLVKSSEKRRRRRQRRTNRVAAQTAAAATVALLSEPRVGPAPPFVHAVIARALGRCKAHGVQKHKRHACILGSKGGFGSQVQNQTLVIRKAKQPMDSDW